MQAVREQLRDLDIEGKFIEQLLKDYLPRKIEEKIDLLMERRNIQRPAGWLMTALKNDYRDEEQERYDEEPAEGSGEPVNTPEWTSREKALKAIKLIQDKLSARISPPPSEEESKTPGRINPTPTKTLNRKLKAFSLHLVSCNLYFYWSIFCYSLLITYHAINQKVNCRKGENLCPN